MWACLCLPPAVLPAYRANPAVHLHHHCPRASSLSTCILHDAWRMRGTTAWVPCRNVPRVSLSWYSGRCHATTVLGLCWHAMRVSCTTVVLHAGPCVARAAGCFWRALCARPSGRCHLRWGVERFSLHAKATAHVEEPHTHSRSHAQQAQRQPRATTREEATQRYGMECGANVACVACGECSLECWVAASTAAWCLGG